MAVNYNTSRIGCVFIKRILFYIYLFKFFFFSIEFMLLTVHKALTETHTISNCSIVKLNINGIMYAFSPLKHERR
jgi:hypothetical protein